jgi:hypothetical protein
MLEYFQIRTWEATLFAVVVFVVWGLLSERARKKKIRKTRGDTQRLAKTLLLKSSIQPSYAPTPTHSHTQGHPIDQPGTILPLSGEPADTNDRYMAAAIGMASNRQDFYRQAWEASRNNEYMTMKPGSW